MNADFEKGTKECCSCKKELQLDMFYKNIRMSDRLDCYCKKCKRIRYSASYDEWRKKYKVYNDKNENTFGRMGRKRGNSGILKRDYELSKEQLDRRNTKRKHSRVNSVKKGHGILIWYSGELEELSVGEYQRAMHKEYHRQRSCAIRGYIGRVNPCEHFLFDFDLEQMLKDNAYNCNGSGKKYYITKWWKGEIRHWTVKDGIWKE